MYCLSMNQYLMFHKLLFVDDATRRSKNFKLLPLLRLCRLLEERGHGWNNAQGWSLSSNDGYVFKTVEPTNKRDIVRCGGAVRRLILVLQTGFNKLFNVKYIVYVCLLYCFNTIIYIYVYMLWLIHAHSSICFLAYVHTSQILNSKQCHAPTH